MKIYLTLSEKLRDLRDERKLKLQDVADGTGIALATLGRIESSEGTQVSFENVAELAKFYNVSTDYLAGVTENRQHRNIEIDALGLSDSAVEVLTSKNLNNRLISELLSSPDFQQLINAIEVYIKKMFPQMQAMNAVYRLAETSIKEHIGDTDPRDEIMAFLQNAVIDEDEYLRFRISERFNDILKKLFESHKTDALSPEHNEAIEDMKDFMEGYMEDRKTQPEAVAKFHSLCKQLQLNSKRLTDEEQRVMMKALERSPLMKRGGNRKKHKKKK